MYTRGEVSLWRDLIEFWVYGVWFAKLLIKHPRRRPRHTATQITHQLCLTNCRVTSSSPSPFRLHLSSSWIVTRKSLSSSFSLLFALASADWYLSSSLIHPCSPLLLSHPHPCSTGSLASCCSRYCRCSVLSVSVSFLVISAHLARRLWFGTEPMAHTSI